MPIAVECKTCGAKLKVKEELAGKLARCPQCKMGISIPNLAPPPVAKSDLEEQDELDFGLEDEPAPTRLKPKKAIPKPKAKTSQEDDLDFVEDEIPEEEILSQLPAKRKKKKPKKERVERDVPESHTSRRDILVWVLLLAMIPLAISIFAPHSSLEERLKKTTAKDPALAEELENQGVHDFLEAHPEVSIHGAHLNRSSLVHWLYALASTVIFLLLLNAMRHQTTVTWWGLLLTGLFTGTFGIAMLLAFQIVTLFSRFMPMYPGVVGLFILILRLIAFSYMSAFDPDSGFLWSFVGFTCGVGLCEEICKAIPVFYYLRNTRSSDWRGTCLLGFASGAGFGISEGIMYASSHYNGIEPGVAYIVRFASCVALHAILSGGVALLMFGNQDYIDSDNEWGTFMVGGMSYIGIAMVLHGLYDTLLKQHLDALALLVALVAFGWLAWLSRYYWDYEPPPAREGIIY